MTVIGEFSFKVIYGLCLLILLCTGFIGLIRSKKQGTTKSKNILLIIIAFTLLLSSFCSSCFYRIAPFNEEQLNDIAASIKNLENQKNDSYFLNTIEFEKWNNNFIETVWLGSSCEISITNTPTIQQEGLLFDVFSKEIDTIYGKFNCSPLFSNGGLGMLHQGYSGFIEFIDLDGTIYRINYEVTRLIDILIGPFYAIPYFGNLDIAELIEQEQGYSPSAAYKSCENFMLENFSKEELDDYTFNEICFVHEYNEALKVGSPEGDYSTPYNPNVFPAIDEKFSDKYLLFYCDNEEYDKATSVILFVIDVDNGSILETQQIQQPTDMIHSGKIS